MFCPSCKDEFRAGFTHCAACDVDLVESLDDAPSQAPVATPAAGERTLRRMADYCGFFTLDDARASRNVLRQNGIASEIVIRDAPADPAAEGGDVEEEFWLRIDATRTSEVAALLDARPEVDEASEGAFGCGECGHMVAADAEVCPGCGAKFDD